MGHLLTFLQGSQKITELMVERVSEPQERACRTRTSKKDMIAWLLPSCTHRSYGYLCKNSTTLGLSALTPPRRLISESITVSEVRKYDPCNVHLLVFKKIIFTVLVTTNEAQ